MPKAPQDIYVTIEEKRLVYDEKRNGLIPENNFSISESHNLHLKIGDEDLVFEEIGSNFFSSWFSFNNGYFTSFRFDPQQEVVTAEEAEILVRKIYNSFSKAGFRNKKEFEKPDEWSPETRSRSFGEPDYVIDGFSVDSPTGMLELFGAKGKNVYVVSIPELSNGYLEAGIIVLDQYVFQGRESSAKRRYRVTMSVGYDYDNQSHYKLTSNGPPVRDQGDSLLISQLR